MFKWYTVLLPRLNIVWITWHTKINMFYKNLVNHATTVSDCRPSFLNTLFAQVRSCSGQWCQWHGLFDKNKFGLNGSAFEKGKPLATSTDSCPPQHLENPSIHDLQHVQQFSRHAADAIFWTCYQDLSLCKFLLIFLLPHRMCVQIFKNVKNPRVLLLLGVAHDLEEGFNIQIPKTNQNGMFKSCRQGPMAQLKHRGSTWSVRRRWNRNSVGVQFPEPTARSWKVTSNQTLHLSTLKSNSIQFCFLKTLQQRNGVPTVFDYGFNHPPADSDHKKHGKQ